MQIITLDEDRQHGLARGAFSFVTKPTTTEGVDAALSRIKEYAKPRRKRLLVVEDNAAEQLSIRELLGHDDIEIVTAGTGAEALATLRAKPCDCVVLDLRLPDMSGFEVLEQIRDDAGAVGRSGRGVHRPRAVGRGGRAAAHHGAQHRGQGRRIAGAAARRDGAVPASRRHRPAAEKQRMLERLNSSDEDLVGRTVLLVDDDARNIFALSSVLERRGMRVLTATTGSEAIALVESTPDLAIVLMDIMMPEMDGYQTMGVIRKKAGVPAPADHRADGQGDEGRPREMPGGRRLRLSGQAGQHRAACCPRCACGSIARTEKAMTGTRKVNILLVDDQPAKLLSYEVILQSSART